LKLVKGRAVRRWKGGDEAVALQLLQRGVAEPWAKKLKGITEAVDATIISGPILDSRVIDVREALRSVQ
jgi:hypothetical protein